jgi:Sec-independent protein secretion pathway component TatC
MLELLSVISLGVMLFVLGILWALWVLYIAMMNIKRVAATELMPVRVKMLVYPTMAVFEVVEFVANVLILTVLFFDWPREIRVSDRLRRYWRDPYRYGWRLYVVRFLKPMLDPFDPAGPHI